MVLLILIPVGLFMYYVYYSDNQAQGRYIIPALYPAMYFVTAGWKRLLERFVKKRKDQNVDLPGFECTSGGFTVSVLYFSGGSVLSLSF